MQIKFVEKGIKLSVESDFSFGNISICDNDSEEEKANQPDSKVISEIETGNKNVVQFLSQLSLSADEKASGDASTDEKHVDKKIKERVHEFSLKYINIFNKGMAFSPIIKIHLSFVKDEKDPMVMEFKIKDIGEIKYYLAPKISES